MANGVCRARSFIRARRRVRPCSPREHSRARSASTSAAPAPPPSVRTPRQIAAWDGPSVGQHQWRRRRHPPMVWISIASAWLPVALSTRRAAFTPGICRAARTCGWRDQSRAYRLHSVQAPANGSPRDALMVHGAGCRTDRWGADGAPVSGMIGVITPGEPRRVGAA